MTLKEMLENEAMQEDLEDCLKQLQELDLPKKIVVE